MTDKQDTLAQAQWWIALLWPVCTGILNALFRFKSADEWAAFVEANPKLATFKRLLSVFGVDVHDAMNVLKKASEK